MTDHTITGSGLFGKNGLILTYGGITNVYMLTGQLADGYTVMPSSPNAVFTSNLAIDSNSYMAFHVNVYVDSASNHLNLSLSNAKSQDHAVLHLLSNGSVQFTGPPNGTVDFVFAGQATSEISYTGFETVY